MNPVIIGLVAVLLTVSTPASARNEYKEFSIADAMASEKIKSRLGDEVKFYFGDSRPAKTLKTIGEWPSLKKTNAFNKSDEFACQWALLSALLSLKKRALSEGGNAVLVKTNNDHRVKSSASVFECEIGNVVASVALLGKVIKADY
ncbi:MAG: excinuclease [Gammaproteobacteria bacterium]|nr:excinuclease [Gammaproteobacteria bacterium]